MIKYTEGKFRRNWRAISRGFRLPVILGHMRTEIRKANEQACLAAIAAVREKISTMAPENAPMTVAIKGVDSPLVDTGSLWQSISYKLAGAYKAFVGVKRTARNFNIAAIVHEGGDITVSRRMFVMFQVLHWKSQGRSVKLSGRARALWRRWKGEWPVLKEGESYHIPGRPYIERAFDSKELITLVRALWQAGVSRAFAKSVR